MPLKHPAYKLLVVVFFHLISSALGKDGSATVNTNHPWPVTSYNFGGLEKLSPKGQGDYDMKELVRILKKSGYIGSVGLMNFHIQETPKNYLPRSIEIWRRYLEQALPPVRRPTRKGS